MLGAALADSVHHVVEQCLALLPRDCVAPLDGDSVKDRRGRSLWHLGIRWVVASSVSLRADGTFGDDDRESSSSASRYLSKVNDLIDFFHDKALPVVKVQNVHKKDSST